MFEKNIELDFTAVAYIWDGKEYKYSAPSEDFGRTYKQVVTKAFIDGHNPEHLKLAAYVGDTAEGQEDGFVSTLVNGAPITIDNSNDLYNLSNAVANGVDSFEKSNFVLSGNMEVDYDFVAIDASMIKSITANEGATVTVYNNKGLEDSILAEGTIDNLTVKNETKLFNMTEKSLDLIWYHDSENRPNNFIESEKLPEISYDGNTTIRYPEKIKGRDAFHREGSNADQIAFKLNYSKQELLDLYNAGTYNTVELTCMLSLKNGGTSVANRIIESSYCDYGIFGAFAENTYVGDTSVYLGRNIQDFSLGYEAWRTYKINLDNFIKAIHDTNFDSKEYTTEYAYLTQFGTFASSDTPAAIFDFYVLDIELVKDVETIWSTEVGVGNDGYQSALGAGVWSYKPTDLSATGYEKDAETGISSAYMTLADTSKNFYAKTTHPEALPTSYTDKNSETVAIDNTGIGECLFLTVQSNSTMMLQARFSSSEIKKIAEKEGYTHVDRKSVV